jgi:hypothetical protein
MSQVDEAQAESVGHSAVFAAEVAKFSRGLLDAFTVRSLSTLAIGSNRTTRIDYPKLGK